MIITTIMGTKLEIRRILGIPTTRTQTIQDLLGCLTTNQRSPMEEGSRGIHLPTGVRKKRIFIKKSKCILTMNREGFIQTKMQALARSCVAKVDNSK